MVTLAHISMILGFTILSLVNENFFKDLTQQTINRFDTSLFFFAGLMDLFMACMMWFIMNDDEMPSVIVNESDGTVY